MSTGSAGPNVGVPRQSERTASENKERAYIAASRRGDRSLEARVQSAYAASEIHKQRTGKALKVSEQIVLNEEMYEEEDDLPARYSALLNNNDILASMPRFQAYAIATLGTRAAAYDRFPNLQRDLQREADVNAQFAEFFGPRGFSTGAAGGFQTHGSTAQQAQASPRTTTVPFSPTTPSHQPAFHYPSPQNALASPVDSHVGSPGTANPLASNSAFPSPSMQMSMHQRSMSMGHMDALQINTSGNLRGMFPQDTDFAGFFAGGHAAATTVSNATQAPFQLQQQQGDLRELRARRQSRGRNTHQSSGSRKESQVTVKKDDKSTQSVKVEKPAHKTQLKIEAAADDHLFVGSDPLHLYTRSQPSGEVKLETSPSDDTVTTVPSDGFEDSNLDGNEFQQFYDADEFTTDFFNSTTNVDQFDFDLFLQLPASQPEAENES
ncbi:hypothetical protein UCDDA912_g03896 [Diaporthe ampelina]|uniref:Uncharacterized protein n=1 Tax=Diaporthe ampelina TaxID=1214573 RepID=A0A0G2FPY8_9PEZI|nr:hypothetical protein UCDDA912_g03896 [Diaporthe ampelina]